MARLLRTAWSSCRRVIPHWWQLEWGAKATLVAVESLLLVVIMPLMFAALDARAWGVGIFIFCGFVGLQAFVVALTLSTPTAVEAQSHREAQRRLAQAPGASSSQSDVWSWFDTSLGCVVNLLLFLGLPLGVLYLLVRFVKWAWTD